MFSAKSEMKKLTDCLWPTIREMFLQRVAEVEKREAHAKRRPIVVLEAAVSLTRDGARQRFFPEHYAHKGH